MTEKKWFGRMREAGASKYLMLALFAALILLLYGMKPESEKTSEKTPLETRLSDVLSQIEGAGRVSAMVTETEEGILGVLIVCEGAENLTVRLRVQEAARTLLGVENEKIGVVKMGGAVSENGERS